MCSYVCMGTFSLKRLLYLSTITITTIIFITYTIDIEPIEVHTKKVSMLKRNNKHRGNRTEPSRKESYTYHVHTDRQLHCNYVLAVKTLKTFTNHVKCSQVQMHTLAHINEMISDFIENRSFPVNGKSNKEK